MSDPELSSAGKRTTADRGCEVLGGDAWDSYLDRVVYTGVEDVHHHRGDSRCPLYDGVVRCEGEALRGAVPSVCLYIALYGEGTRPRGR